MEENLDAVEVEVRVVFLLKVVNPLMVLLYLQFVCVVTHFLED